MYEVLLFSLYRNLSPSSFLLSSRGWSFASTCRASTGKVLKAPVYILMPSLCMLTSFFLCYIIKLLLKVFTVLNVLITSLLI